MEDRRGDGSPLIVGIGVLLAAEEEDVEVTREGEHRRRGMDIAVPCDRKMVSLKTQTLGAVL